MIKQVLWVSNHRVVRVPTNMGFGYLRRKGADWLIGLGPLGVFRYEQPGHRVAYRQPVYKKV